MKVLRSVSVLLVGTLTILLASACGLSTNADDPAGDAPVTNPDGFSLLTREGVDAIQEAGRARFDLRERTITRKAVGLETGRLGPVVGGAGEPDLTLELVAPERTEEVRTSTFSVTFTGNDDRASTVTWFEAYDTDTESQEALKRAVERWGLPADQPAAWRQASETGEEELTLRAGVAPSGLASSLTVRRTSSGGQTHQWMLLLRPGLYTPESLEQIRRTGRIPLG